MKKFLITSLALTQLLVGCQKNDPFGGTQTNPPIKSIPDLVSSDRNFARLNQAIAKAGIGSALAAANLTVFAPTNAAFASAGFDSVTIIKTDAATLSAVLRYHVLSTVVRSSDLQTVINRETPTLNGTAYVTKYNFGTPAVAVNGVRVTLADIAATNGVVHIVDNVILPPTGTIASVVSSNPNFTFLLAAATRAGLVAALSGPGPITVFAPTDEAFRTTTPYKTIDLINAADPAALAAILRFHVTPGRVFTTNFLSSAYTVPGSVLVSGDRKKPGTLPTLADSTLRVDGNLKLNGWGNGTELTNITRGNLLTTNGVIHVIDRVLLPR